jgi:hypothetical protein
MANISPKLGKFFRVGGITLILLLLLGGIGYYTYKKLRKTSTQNSQVEISVPDSTKDVFVNDVTGVQEASKDKFPDYISQSENYALREITFGGYEIDMSGEAKNVPLEISDVRGESVISKDGKTTKMLFSWKTNKLATSDVTYSKNDGPIKNTLSESGPGLAHALILNFEPATRYTYFITAKDHWGNTITSEKFSAYTSIKNDNIIDLISQQFKQIFGWIKIN